MPELYHHCTMSDLRRMLGDFEWLVPNWIPRGAVTMLTAAGGVGKTWFALELVKSLTLGRPWFSGKNEQKVRRAIWCDTEHRTRENLKRMQALEIPEERVYLPLDAPSSGALPEKFNLENADHYVALESKIRALRAPLVVIDSLSGAHGMDENSAQMAVVLHGLSAAAGRNRGCVAN